MIGKYSFFNTDCCSKGGFPSSKGWWIEGGWEEISAWEIIEK